MMGVAIGIDLGSTKSVVAVADQPGQLPRLLRNEFGETETPAVIAEDKNGEIIVGRRAAYRRPHDTITCAKRHLGDDKIFSLPHREAVRAGDAVSLLLKDLKNTAERELGDEVDGATIGVPLFWNSRLLSEFRDAAARAGFNRVQLVPEPVAAVMASYPDDTVDDSKPLRVLTYDLGGGKFEAAVVEIRDGQFTVLCGAGDGSIGGCEFDGRLAKLFWEKLRADGFDLPAAPNCSEDEQVYSELLQQAEQAKIRLSLESTVQIRTSLLGQDRSGQPLVVDAQIDREQFEGMIAPDVDRTVYLCRQMLDEVCITFDQLDDALLLGGSSKIPLVRHRFDETCRRESRRVDAVHCVAIGAARLAGRTLQGSHSQAGDGPYEAYLAVLSHPIQFESNQGFHQIVSAGVRLPVATTLQFKFRECGQDRQLRIPLFESGVSIGEIQATIPVNCGPETVVELTLHIDNDSHVSATIHCPQLGWQQHVPLQPVRPSPTFDPPLLELQRLVAETRAVLCHVADRSLEQDTVHLECMLSTIQDEADRAWYEQNERRWRECFQRLLELRSRLPSQDMQPFDEFELLVRIVPALLHEVVRLNAETPPSSECVADVQQLLRDVEKVDFSARRLTRSDPEVHQTLNHAKDCVRRFQSLKQRLELRSSRPNSFGVFDIHGNVWEWCQDGRGGWRVTDDSNRTLRGGSWQTLRSGSPQVPAATIDCVHFSVTSPTSVQPAATFILDVWAHLEQQRKLVLERAQQQHGGRDVLMQSRGPVSVARGTVLTVRLKIEGLQVPDPEDTILWHGEIGNARFQINVPQDAAPGERAGVAGIYADGLRIAKLYFSIPVTEHAGATATIPLKHDRHQRAFASYASEDRDQVLGRLQGMQKRTPSLEIFLDVLALRSGQNWEQELYREISRSDVFYLFWSNYARNSEWVDREWHCALERRGIDFIDPVPLVDPKVVPPPPELASKHFNDWVLAFLSPLNGVPPVS